jgi:exonuclease III
MFNVPIKVSSFNCKNVRSSVEEIRNLCDKSDIVILQETWLNEADITFLTTIHSSFYCTGVSSMRCDQKVLRGRPYGGLGILWRKSIGQCCSVVPYDDPRILGLEVSTDSNRALIVNLYMPYDCSDNEDDFMYYLGKISDIIETHSNSHVFVMGDFNANIKCGNVSSFGKMLKSYCTDENLVIADEKHLDSDTFTFVSSAHNTCSWLDHVVTTHTGSSLISSIGVMTEFVTSDHIPLFMELDFNCSQIYDNVDVKSKSKVDWSSLDVHAIEAYTQNTKDNLSKIVLDFELLTCTDQKCINHNHKCAIDKMYGAIIHALEDASAVFMPEKSKHHGQTIPGWNDYVKESHCDAREAFLMWQAHGKPRFGPVCDLMNKTRARFKYCLRYCKSVEDKAKADAIAKKFLNKDCKNFWKDIKKLNKVGADVLATTVDSVTGENNVCNMWRDHYNNLLNSNNTHKTYVEKAIKDLENI